MKRIEKSILCFLLFLIFFQIISSCSNDKKFKELKEYIQFKMARDKIPGLVVLIIKDDAIHWSEGFGMANIEKSIPMTEQSILCVASIAKSITAIAVMQLVEAEKLVLDDPINDYLPFEIKHPLHPKENITIAQILTHTSSISNGPSLWRNFCNGDSKITIEEWARSYLLPDGRFYHRQGNFERWKPGTDFLYSNGGYGLLAYLVECVSGMTFNDYCQKYIFKPLKMHHSSFLISQLDTLLMATMYGYGDFPDLEKDLAVSKAEADSAIERKTHFRLFNYSSPDVGAGRLYTNSEDLSHYLIAIMNNGVYKDVSILKPKTLNMMFSPKVDRNLLPPWFIDLGMGGYSMRLDIDEPVWGHTGANPGISSLMQYNSDIKLGVIILANRFVDIRDLIQWTFAEGYDNLITSSKNIPQSWNQYSKSYMNKTYKKRKITIHVTPKIMPSNSTVFVIGNHRFLGSWISKGIPLVMQPDGSWTRSFSFYDSTELIFKITRGGWDKQSVDENGEVYPDFRYDVRSDTTFQIVVDNWKDLYHGGK